MNSNVPDDDVISGDGIALSGEELAASYPAGRYHGQIRDQFTIPEREPQYVPAVEVLPAELASRLEVDLWSHQAEALSALRAGENVCVSTSTSSGKTYVYGLEIARQYLEDPDVRALLVYPTKALSRDQRANSRSCLGTSASTSRSASTTATPTPRRNRGSARSRTSSSPTSRD